MSEGGDRLGEAQKQAAAKGLIVVHPADDELFVDIDDDASYGVFQENLAVIRRQIAHLDISCSTTPSPSRRSGRYHIRVKMPRPVTPIERIALQAILGSDRKREALSWCRIETGVGSPTLFFEKPEET